MEYKVKIDLLINQIEAMNASEEVTQFIESAFQNPHRRYFYLIDGAEKSFSIRRNGFIFPDEDSVSNSLFEFAKDDMGNFLSVENHCDIVVWHHEYDQLFPLLRSGDFYKYKEGHDGFSKDYARNVKSIDELDSIDGYDSITMTFEGELVIEQASMCGNIDLIASAIANGSPHGYAVALAARNNHTDCLKLLLKSNFSPFGGYKDEADLLDMPKLLGYSNVVRLIESYRERKGSNPL